MTEKRIWPTTSMWLAIVAGVVSLLIIAPGVDAKSKRVKRSKGLPRAVAAAPVCDMQINPKIMKVTPDPVKPGQKITIKGKNFGTKACFKQVSFGRTGAKSFKYINSKTLVARVPNLKPGITKVNILTTGGSSEYVVLIEKGKRAKKAKRSKKARRSKRSKRR